MSRTPSLRILLLISAAVAGMAAACEANGASERSETGPNPGTRPAGSPGLTTGAVAALELDATYPEGFTFLNGVRELSDGTLLAADPLAEVLLRIDQDWTGADTVGRAGPGPQEYEQPDQVLPLPGDSTLLVDLGKMQLTQIGPDGVFGEGFPMAVPTGGRFPMVLQPWFTDAEGRLYDQAPRSRDGGPVDSVAIVRFHRASRLLDTITTIWFPEIPQVRSRGGGFVPRMLGAMDTWAAGDDGRVAVIRAQDFSVEWTYPDGHVAQGPPHPFPSHRAGRAEKEAVIAGMGSNNISMTSVSGRDGSVARMTMSRGRPPGAATPGVEDFEWSETLPPFRAQRARVSTRGEVWVERYLPVDSLPQIEVFDGEGTHLGSIQLPRGRQVIGFGTGPGGSELAYLVRTDELDLKWLERYRVVR